MKLPTLRQVSGFIMIVNTLLPAILVFIFVGIYVLFVTPLKEDLGQIKAQIKTDYDTAIGPLQKHYGNIKDDLNTIVGLYEDVKNLSDNLCGTNITLTTPPARKTYVIHASNIRTQPAYGVQHVADELRSVSTYKITNPTTLVRYDENEKTRALRYSSSSIAAANIIDSATAELSRAAKKIDPSQILNDAKGAAARIVNNAKEKAETVIGDAKRTANNIIGDARKKAAKILGDAEATTCNVISVPFEKTFDTLKGVMAPFKEIRLATLQLANFYSPINKMYSDANTTWNQIKANVDVTIDTPATKIIKRISNLYTALTFIAIALAVWFVISYISWVFGRLERGWKMFTAKD